MSLSRYPKYKESRVPWIDEVPDHWSHTPVKRIARPGNRTFIDGDWIEAPYITAEGVRLLQCGNIGTGVFEEQGFRFVSEETFNNLGCTEVEPNDVLICRLQSSRTILAGRACLAPQLGVKMITSVDNCIVKPSSDFDPRYVVYQLSTTAYLSFIEVVARGGTRDRISRSMLGDIELVVAPVGEQRAIADFLDRETAKIDVLVEEQRRLIELLKEKRQAVISHAVTKGLNPDAPMKDSGIEWLGEVPAHWNVKRIKYAIRKLEQGWSPQCENFPAEAGEWGILKVGCVNGGSFNPEENKALPPELSPIPELGICAGDVMISRANTRELAGSAAVAKSSYPRLLLCDKLYRLHMREGICLPEYLAMFLRTPPARSEIELSATGASSSMVNIGQSTITEMSMPLPSLEEQRGIVAFVAEETGKSGQLIAEATRAIDLLQERRTALISAAVTGKIDVRGLATGEAA